MSPFYTALVSGAVCEFCGASIAHASSDGPAMESFTLRGWDFLPVPRTAPADPPKFLAACPNPACQAELHRLEEAGRR